MTDASTSETMSPGLLKVVERVKTEPEGRFHSLAHLIDVSAMTRAYRRMRKDAAPRLKAKQYRPPPVRRVEIPKGTGTRPLGIPTVEDRLLQRAVARILSAITNRIS